MVKQCFSICGADTLLTAISPLVRKAQILKQRIDRYEHTLIRENATIDEEFEEKFLEDVYDTEEQEVKNRFYKTIEKIEEKGCIVRDIDEGTIEFPAFFQGKDIFLVWHLGEKQIKYWRCEEEEEERPILEIK